jgi:hypothetical protein
MLAIVKVATMRRAGPVEIPAPAAAPIAKAPAGEAKPEVDAPPVSEAELPADDRELPYPQDVEAVARYHGTSGRKDIGDAEFFWQKGADMYIEFLDGETFEQGIYRAYMKSELLVVAGDMDQIVPGHPDIVRLLVRTRRVSKLIDQVNEARGRGDTGRLVEAMDTVVKRLMAERREVEQTLEQMMETEPESFTSAATEEQRYRVIDLSAGYALTGFDVAEGVIPMSLHGTQYGIVTNCFLLGLTEDQRAVSTLLEVLSYNDEPFIKKFAEACGDETGLVREWSLLANRVVIADALDRILVAASGGEGPAGEAGTLTRQYQQWRLGQDLGSRKGVQVYAYDSPRTPYHLPGSIMGAGKAAAYFEVELPLALWQDAPRQYRLNEEAITKIIEFGERFQAALGAK